MDLVLGMVLAVLGLPEEATDMVWALAGPATNFLALETAQVEAAPVL